MCIRLDHTSILQTGSEPLVPAHTMKLLGRGCGGGGGCRNAFDDRDFFELRSHRMHSCSAMRLVSCRHLHLLRRLCGHRNRDRLCNRHVDDAVLVQVDLVLELF